MTLDEYLEPVSCKSPFTKYLVDGGDWIPTRSGASFLVDQIIVEQSSNLASVLSMLTPLMLESKCTSACIGNHTSAMGKRLPGLAPEESLKSRL